MLIDAHQHFWRIADRTDQWPPAELVAIHRDFEPGDLEPLLKGTGIGGTVLVQTMERASDTAFMLALADRHPFILGVVGWTDLKAPNAVGAIGELARHPKLKGLRPMLQDLPDDAWIADPALKDAADAMAACGLAFDALVLPRHLAALHVFAERHPSLRIVIDHGAKPPIGTGRSGDWRRGLAKLAKLENVSCKLSGLLTETGDLPAPAIRPYAETLLELFGPERLIWGSDWPVLRLAGDYRAWFDQCRDIVPSQHHQNVFGANAASFYRLRAPVPAQT